MNDCMGFRSREPTKTASIKATTTSEVRSMLIAGLAGIFILEANKLRTELRRASRTLILPSRASWRLKAARLAAIKFGGYADSADFKLLKSLMISWSLGWNSSALCTRLYRSICSMKAARLAARNARG